MWDHPNCSPRQWPHNFCTPSSASQRGGPPLETPFQYQSSHLSSQQSFSPPAQQPDSSIPFYHSHLTKTCFFQDHTPERRKEILFFLSSLLSGIICFPWAQKTRLLMQSWACAGTELPFITSLLGKWPCLEHRFRHPGKDPYSVIEGISLRVTLPSDIYTFKMEVYELGTSFI